MAMTGLLFERRWLRHVGRDRCFVGAQIAEQRISIREPTLDQAPAEWHGRHCHGGGRCNGRGQRDNRRDTEAIYAETRAAIERVTPAETRTPGPSPVAEELGAITEVRVTVEAR